MTNIIDIDTGMPTVIDITTGQPVVTLQHRRIADKIASLIHGHEPVEHICVCGYRDVRGDSICSGCPEGPRNPPENAA